jgi:hypothetical protein
VSAGTCEARTGLHLGGLVDTATSLAGAWGCPEPATVTLRAACVHEHVREKRFCAGHGVINPADGVWLCLPCAELGHDCPVSPQVVADAA